MQWLHINLMVLRCFYHVDSGILADGLNRALYILLRADSEKPIVLVTWNGETEDWNGIEHVKTILVSMFYMLCYMPLTKSFPTSLPPHRNGALELWN